MWSFRDRDLGENGKNVKTDQQVILINWDGFHICNEINIIIDVRGSTTHKLLKVGGHIMTQGMVGSSNGIYNGMKGNILFIDFQLTINFQSLWGIMNELTLNGYMDGGGIYDHVNK